MESDTAPPSPPPSQERRFHLSRDGSFISNERVECMSSLPVTGNNRSLLFSIPKVEGTGILASRLKLNLKIRVLTEGPDGLKLIKNQKLIISGLPPASIFAALSVKMGNSELFYLGHDYGLYSKYVVQTQISKHRKALLAAAAGDSTIRFDTGDVRGGTKTVNGKKETVWAFPGNIRHREDRSGPLTDAARDGVFSMATYLLLDILNSLKPDDPEPIIPSTLPINVSLTPEAPKKWLLTDVDAESSIRLEIREASLGIARVWAAREKMIPRSLRWDYRKVNLSPCVVSAGSTEVHHTVLIEHRTPLRLIVMPLTMERYDGSVRLAHFKTEHFGLSELVVTVGSRRFPSSPIRASFKNGDYSELYLYAHENLDPELHGSAWVPMADWENGQFSLVVDLEKSGGRATQRSGSLALSAHFEEPLAKDVCLFIVLEYAASLKIDGESVAVKYR